MKITLILGDGTTAWIERGDWQSELPELAQYLNEENRRKGAISHMPHPYLHVAEAAAAEGDAELLIEGEDDSEEGSIC